MFFHTSIQIHLLFHPAFNLKSTRFFMKQYSFLFLLIFLPFFGCTPQESDNISSQPHTFERTEASTAGLIADSLDRVTEFLQEAVNSDKIPGAVLSVVKDGALVYEESLGMVDIENGEEMRSNHIFRMASMTKAITSVAILMLAEQGNLSVNDPVSDYIPEFCKCICS